MKWNYGDVFAVPLVDDSWSIGQAIGSMMPHIVYCVFFDTRFPSLPSSPSLSPRPRIVALLATWKESLNFGDWPVVATSPSVVELAEFSNERFRASGYVGAKHYDEGIVEDFLSAYHGLVPWNVMADEHYYDALLRGGVARPASAIMLSADARQKYRVEKGWAK